MWQWLKRLYHRLGSPKWFYEISARWIPWLALVSVVGAVTGLVWGLAYAPADYLQGNSFRIIYIHVPAIGAMHFATQAAIFMRQIRKMAPATAIIMWWVWDARLTSMLMLLFLYFGVMALQQAMESEDSSYRAGAILALVGVVNIPIIKYSVEWWNTLHQPATLKLTEKPSMDPSMLWPLLIMIVTTYAFFALLVILRTRNEILWHERKRQWVRELLEH